jgi:hypothetical protein
MFTTIKLKLNEVVIRKVLTTEEEAPRLGF